MTVLITTDFIIFAISLKGKRRNYVEDVVSDWNL
jgi:hypothetical protein